MGFLGSVTILFYVFGLFPNIFHFIVVNNSNRISKTNFDSSATNTLFKTNVQPMHQCK
ncbi:hypothetical protein BYT27DRAFT_6668337 [Phlegmacium glaucopus]|nr:hypothetical protein BYT27DRAFT_6668337 [Phlegmacium glaucopus]